FDAADIFAPIGRALDLFRLTQGAPLASALFLRKIGDTAQQAYRALGMAFAQSIVAVTQNLLDRDWDGIPESVCHGDMTLENLLLRKDRGAVFIDCDEPFVSSSWLDLAKLCQDIDGH